MGQPMGFGVPYGATNVLWGFSMGQPIAFGVLCGATNRIWGSLWGNQWDLGFFMGRPIGFCVPYGATNGLRRSPRGRSPAHFPSSRPGGGAVGALTNAPYGARCLRSQPACSASAVANTGPLARPQPTAKLRTPACTQRPPDRHDRGPPESAWGGRKEAIGKGAP